MQVYSIVLFQFNPWRLELNCHMVIIDTKRNKWFVQYSVINWVPSLHVNPALGMAVVEPVG